MNIRYCSPEPGHGHGHYEGWHLKSLKVFDSREAAEAAADRCGGEAFYCEYGNCYHIGGGSYMRRPSVRNPWGGV